MIAEALVRALHFIAIMAMAGALISSHLSLSKELPRRTLRRLAVVDIIFYVSAALTLTAGLILWFGVGKPASYYLSNGLFHGKITLFVIAIALGIPASLFWRKQGKGEPDELVPLPRKVRPLQGVQLVIVFVLIPIMATMVARGVGAGD